MDGWKMATFYVEKGQSARTKSASFLRKAAFFGFVFGALVLPYDALAEENSPVTETGTVVVTGTRTEQLIEDVPQTMQVFTKEDIERMGAANVRDVLNSATGISVEGQKGGINIRGMGWESTLLLINGRRVSTAENVKDAYNYWTQMINPASIERIEIVRGQAGAIYGSNAIGGVVNIITKKSEKAGGVGGVIIGNEYVKNYWQLDTGKMGKFDAIFNAQITHWFGGMKEPAYDTSIDSTYSDRTNGGWTKSHTGNELAFNLDMGYAFTDDHEIRFIGNWASTDREQDSKSAAGYVSTNHNDSRRLYGGALVYQGTIGDHMLNLSADYSEVQVDKFRDPLAVQAMAGYNASLVDNSEKYFTDTFRTFTLGGNDSWTITDWNTLTFGGEYTYSNAHQVNTATGKSGIRNFYEMNSWSIYLSEELAFFDDSLFILLQGRYDHYDTDFGGAFTPNIGVTYEFIENHRLKANWGMGFRAPTLAELYGVEGTGNGTVYGSETLKPEKSKNFEVRYEGSYGPVSGSVGYYYSYIEDYISSEQVFDTNLYPYQHTTQASFLRTNIGQVRTQGIELEAAWQVHDYVKLKASYSYNDAHDIDNHTRVTYTATDVVTAGIDFFHPEWGLSANLWGSYNENFKSAESAKAGATIYDFYNVNFSAAKTWGEEDEYKVTFALYNFLQSKNNSANITSLNPLEVRVGFEMKF